MVALNGYETRLIISQFPAIRVGPGRASARAIRVAEDRSLISPSDLWESASSGHVA